MPLTGNERLDSWKEIADYLHLDVRTVTRWEKEKGLPVHRVPGGAPFKWKADPDEIIAAAKRGPQTLESIH